MLAATVAVDQMAHEGTVTSTSAPTRSPPAGRSRHNPCVLITFDLFSALIDSRLGASAVLDGLARARGWPVDGGTLYDEWDRRNKASQRDEPQWIPFAEHCRRALADTYRALDLGGAADDDVAVLLRSVGDWPLWPDVVEGLPAIAARHRVGILSNVDDDVFARTRVAALVGDDAVLTSERLRAYKPGPEHLPPGAGARRRRAGARGDVGPRRPRRARGRHRDGPAAPARARAGPRRPQPEREAADLGRTGRAAGRGQLNRRSTRVSPRTRQRAARALGVHAVAVGRRRSRPPSTSRRAPAGRARRSARPGSGTTTGMPRSAAAASSALHRLGPAVERQVERGPVDRQQHPRRRGRRARARPPPGPCG